jgi:nucleoside-diphosphate-sugar epimerase
VRLTLDGETVKAEERIPMDARIRDVVQAPDGSVFALTDETTARSCGSRSKIRPNDAAVLRLTACWARVRPSRDVSHARVQSNQGTAFTSPASPYKRLVALTGATGFIGQHLLRELPKRGYRLRVLLRRPSSAPIECASALIGDLARPHNMSEALAEVDAVIHSAGVAQAMSGVPEDDYRLLNTEATIKLARAAERAGVRRFVFLSSIRAQSGSTADGILHEALEPRPTDAYGRSKLAAEQGLAESNLDWVALRLVLVYGPGVQGNMARLAELARSPYPLPLASLKARRSLLALDNLVEAVAKVLDAPRELKRPFIVADPDPLTVGEMIMAMRHGLGRRGGLFPVPSPVLKAALQALGHAETYRLFAGSLVADSSALGQVDWAPSTSTRAGLAALMQAVRERNVA